MRTGAAVTQLHPPHRDRADPGLHQALRSMPVPQREDAEAAYLKGIGAARAQGARAWELRLARGLAQLWRDQRRTAEARAMLAPLHGSSTEGFAFH
jgi:hypothetical protein